MILEPLATALLKMKYENHTERSEIHTADGSYHWNVMHTIIWYVLVLIYVIYILYPYITIIMYKVHVQMIRQYS